MKKSLFLKIFSGYAIFTLILASAVLFTAFHAIRDFAVDMTTSHLKDLAASIKPQIEKLPLTGRSADLDRIVRELGTYTSARLTVVREDGVVLADSEEDPSKMENHGTRTEIAQALEGKTGFFLRKSGTLQKEMLYVALPLGGDKEKKAVLRLSVFLKEMAGVTDSLRGTILVVTALFVLLYLVISLIFTRNLTRPVRELTDAAEKMAQGDFDVRVLPSGNDEMKDLAVAFNSMAGEIKTLVSELSRQKEELKSIIASLREGLAVLNSEDQIVLCNESFREIAKTERCEGHRYWEILREPRFSEVIRDVKQLRHNMVSEMAFGGRTFSVSATLLESESEIVAVFHDVTESKKIEKMKSDFVLNLSHELRTPLTSIKGFVETLDDEIEGSENKRYLEIIKRNTNRVISIISDLLLLAEMEDSGTTLELSEVDIPRVADNTKRIFEHLLAEKNLSFSTEITPGLPPVEADLFKVEQLFINLVDNAVKYTEKGGITISARRKDESVEILFTDTGQGIPAEHLPRIFERFYVVDKSRSKNLGGTGLGLSIVKHVVILHKGTITITSTPGTGTTVTVELPLKSGYLNRKLTQN